MKANHIPQAERIKNRINGLLVRQDAARRPARGGNPYWSCRECGIYDPQLSINGAHYKGCPVQGLDKQIEYFKNLLTTAKKSV